MKELDREKDKERKKEKDKANSVITITDEDTKDKGTQIKKKTTNIIHDIPQDPLNKEVVKAS